MSTRTRLLLLLTVGMIASLVAACDGGGLTKPTEPPSPDGEPETPTAVPTKTLLKEDFDDGIADGWRTENGTWGIHRGEYDQDGRGYSPTWSYYPGLTATDYSVQTDVKLMSEGYVQTDHRTASLAVRMTDADNFYLAALSWQENNLTLYKVTGGEWLALGHRPQMLAPDTWYNLRMVARGPFLRVYLDDILQIEATAEDHPGGFVGLRANGGHFRIDNICVNTVPTLASAAGLPLDDAFDDGDSDSWWKLNGWWRTADGALEQNYAGTGEVWGYQPYRPAANYRVETRFQALPESANGKIGVMLRMSNETTGYWGVLDLTARELQIFVRVAGDWTRLGNRPLPPGLDVGPAEWHTLAFEATGPYLRLWLDDTTIETTDDTHQAGFFGVWFNRMGARIDAVQARTVSAPPPLPEALPFEDTFDDGFADGWRKQGGGWGVVEVDGVLDQGDFTLGGVASAWVEVEAQNYAVTLRAQLVPQAYAPEHDRAIGLMIRRVGADHAYVASVNVADGTAQLWYGDGQTWIPLSDPAPVTFNTYDWNTLRVEAFGEQLRFRLNGDLVVSASDSRLVSGSFGVRIREGHFQIDDVQVEEIER